MAGFSIVDFANLFFYAVSSGVVIFFSLVGIYVLIRFVYKSMRWIK